ncbi:MAG: hypothetical protein KF771_05275 [Burkholderiales bacterium]|nr:hypothetical protein [Burkholderiales bacterium]
MTGITRNRSGSCSKAACKQHPQKYMPSFEHCSHSHENMPERIREGLENAPCGMLNIPGMPADGNRDIYKYLFL